MTSISIPFPHIIISYGRITSHGQLTVKYRSPSGIWNRNHDRGWAASVSSNQVFPDSHEVWSSKAIEGRLATAVTMKCLNCLN